MPIVHGVPLSPFVRKVRLVLEEKGVPYELRPLVPFPKTPELLAVSPLGKMPLFEEGAFITPDSSVICAYLERTRPDPALYPTEAHEYARALWFEEYADTALAEAIGAAFFQRIVRPSFFGEDADESVVAHALTEEVPRCLGYLDGCAGSSEGIAGGAFGVADIAIHAQLQNLQLLGVTIDPAHHPRLARYTERMSARPSLARIAGEDRESMQAA